MRSIKNVEKLAEKRTHLRKGVEKFMDEWAEKTKCVEGLHAEVLVVNEYCGEYRYCIRTGKKDLYWDSSQGFSDSSDRWSDYNQDKFYEVMSIPRLREVCSNLAGAIEKIQHQIDAENEEIDNILKKLS